ncbi:MULTISPECIES: DUF2997 domain-containing protein [unclassified Prochlorococcus]|uniref:DUF2997 domain-containing protein n=1 Tax=unclassified Prochlorococcus TaxID=2627481 RepID=UPI0005337C27|nr:MULTISPECIES: DUF2997 domain-containing protein [unclassified Prochlorococcus]KGG14760.1 hypothetical protein EV06_1821 [Prochlorococcus sp. MIT 0602]KGG15809.1 hypothetical protein EV07_1775 [Prochlorococcus sp. MIT 0603]
MPNRTLKFKIRQDGLVEETVEGVIGQDCYQLTKKLEAALGSVEQTELTSEAYNSSSAVQSQLTPEQIQII